MKLPGCASEEQEAIMHAQMARTQEDGAEMAAADAAAREAGAEECHLLLDFKMAAVGVRCAPACPPWTPSRAAAYAHALRRPAQSGHRTELYLSLWSEREGDFIS
ncbi:MAG: hypothetical protein ACK4ZJ_16780, partial [Allorhizobium sp.]